MLKMFEYAVDGMDGDARKVNTFGIWFTYNLKINSFATRIQTGCRGF